MIIIKGQKKIKTTYHLDEEVFAELERRLVLVDHGLACGVLLNVALEEVERRVVPIEHRVLQVLGHRHFELAARITFAHFEK